MVRESLGGRAKYLDRFSSGQELEYLVSVLVSEERVDLRMRSILTAEKSSMFTSAVIPIDYLTLRGFNHQLSSAVGPPLFKPTSQIQKNIVRVFSPAPQ